MSLDPGDREILRDLLAVSKESRDAAVRAAAASERALGELRTLNEIVAREVSPLGPFRADLITRLEEHFRKIGQLVLEVGDLREWRDDHVAEHHKAAANGSG